MKEICGIKVISRPRGWATIKSIPGFRGRYYASRDGRIFSRRKLKDGTPKETELRPSPHPSGYLQVRLSKNGRVETHYVHRLVAVTHLSNPKKLPDIRHRDGDKSNNCVSNLQWISPTLAQRPNNDIEALQEIYSKHAEEIVALRRHQEMTPGEISAFMSGEFLPERNVIIRSWLLERHSVREIAQKLGLSVKQVRYCLERWFARKSLEP